MSYVKAFVLNWKDKLVWAFLSLVGLWIVFALCFQLFFVYLELSGKHELQRNVINWIEKLNEVNTDNIEPMINVHNEPLHLNADEVSEGNIADDVLKNAPKQIYGYFAVPKVIE